MRPFAELKKRISINKIKESYNKTGMTPSPFFDTRDKTVNPLGLLAQLSGIDNDARSRVLWAEQEYGLIYILGFTYGWRGGIDSWRDPLAELGRMDAVRLLAELGKKREAA
jgi:hypothetical protein